ncbi:MAG: tRNA 2-thiouridine(34) synthase MnmA [Candidatus Falkowbacteria bacterium]
MNKNLNKKKRVLVAMSGGVDSAVAAQLLVNQGYSVTGVFLHFWKDGGTSMAENKCCSLQALNDARRVAKEVGIELYTLDFKQAFKLAVVDNFLSEYQKGRTPNPCVLCNKKVKLGRLIKSALAMKFDYVASGHYLKIKKVGTKYHLYRAVDKNKDQSYFLYTFDQKELSHLMFPLANYKKPRVRELAKKWNLPVAEKSESQEICFIPGKHHNDFLKKYISLFPGDIKLMDGTVLGQHQGLSLYTIGQRRGIEIGGTGPYYAAKFDWKNNILYVVKDFDDLIFYKNKLIAKKVNWISGKEPKLPFACSAVIRYRHPAVKCTAVSKNTRGYEIVFKEAQRAITPGQSVVFYQGQEVLGGGIID